MRWWHIVNFQEARRPVIEQIKIFHDHTLVIIRLILVGILYLIVYLMFNELTNNTLVSGHTLESVWTITPAFILIILAIPRMKLLYLIEERFEPLTTLKVIGHQWYWSYEYSDFIDLEFESYMVPDNELAFCESRLLERDHRVVLPLGEMIRAVITRDDVIHAWRVPRIGIKCDAVPGRLNQIQFTPSRVGQFYGQCSEICGANHSFIPITLEIVPFRDFIKWL